MSEYWKEWIHWAGIRTIRTFAETATGIIGASVLIEDVNWIHVLSASLLSSIVCLLAALAGLPEINSTKSRKRKK